MPVGRAALDTCFVDALIIRGRTLKPSQLDALTDRARGAGQAVAGVGTLVDAGRQRTAGTALLDPQSRHHAIPDRHDAADVPGVLGHQPVVLPDEGSHAGLALFVGSGCDVATPERVVTQP